MHVENLQLFLMRVGHFVSLGGFCLPLYSLHDLYREVDEQTKLKPHISMSALDRLCKHTPTI